jgi:hypothetical protein
MINLRSTNGAAGEPRPSMSGYRDCRPKHIGTARLLEGMDARSTLMSVDGDWRYGK